MRNTGEGIVAIAFSPPEFEKNFLVKGQRMSSVNSSTPYALMSTLAQTFQLVHDGVLNVLNWKSPEGIRDSVFLMHHWQQEIDILEEKLTRLMPDIVFMGTFAMNFPGAIASASMVKKILPETLLTLGGRHINETFWSDIDVKNVTIGEIHEHREANPLRLMQSGAIPPVFDLIVSGQGQDLIPALIEAVQETKKSHGKRSSGLSEIVAHICKASGYWTLGQYSLLEKEIIYTQPEKYTPLSVSDIHSPYRYAGADSVHFPVFQGSDWTAHVHSDSQGTSGNTCTQNCGFCSEAIGKNPLRIPHEIDAADRLFSRFQDIMEVAAQEGQKPSIFVEDSILCGGHWGAMERFCELLENENSGGESLPLQWGCQFTVPLILSEKGDKIIQRLKKCGLTYIYFGLESAKPEIAIQVAKSSRIPNWSAATETAIANLTKKGINVGTSNIFCMGESQEERMNQLQLIKSWQLKYAGNPCVYSLNLQTVHPGEWRGDYMGPKYDYISWGLDLADPRSSILQELFGEASVRYLRHPESLPSLPELQEIKTLLTSLHNQT